jgi:hypothetical protein
MCGTDFRPTAVPGWRIHIAHLGEDGRLERRIVPLAGWFVTSDCRSECSIEPAFFDTLDSTTTEAMASTLSWRANEVFTIAGPEQEAPSDQELRGLIKRRWQTASEGDEDFEPPNDLPTSLN